MSLSIKLLGHFQVTRHGTLLSLSRARRIEALLICLALAPERQQARGQLASLLFPEVLDSVARTNLRQIVKRLRAWLGKEDPPYLLITTDWLQLNPRAAWTSDVWQFQQYVRGCERHLDACDGGCAACITGLQRALDLCEGPLLDGFFITESETFERWLAQERQHMQQAMLQAGQMVADYYEWRGQYDVAERFVRQLIAWAPWEEGAHHQLMRLLAWQGHRGAALLAYEACCEVLANELGVEPSAALTALAGQIRLAPAQRPSALPARSQRPFVGRDTLLGDIRLRLAKPGQQLITLWGPGGVGKTQLALQVAWAAAQAYWGPFLHGVFWVTVTHKITPLLLATAVAEALAVSLDPTPAPQMQLPLKLQDKSLLLILDNGELLEDETCVFIDALRQAAPQLKLMITSRKRLNLAAEWCVEVTGLSYPPLAAQQRGGQVAPPTPGTYPAMRLFAQRARQIDGHFSLDDAAVRLAAAHICQLTRGIPLALELAAVWVRSLTCQEIAQEIETTLDILQTNLRDYDPRHRSMRAVFETSWCRLTPVEQAGLSRLSVFPGRFDYDAARDVAQTDYVTITSLIDKSLLTKAPEPPHLEMHPLLRQFAAEKLPYPQEIEARHAAFYGRFLQERQAALKGDQLGHTLAQIHQHLENIRAGWQWAITHQQLELIHHYAPPLYDFYALRGWRYEGREMFQKAAVLREVFPVTDHPLLFTHLLSRLAEFHDALGEMDEAEKVLQESLAIGGLVEDPIELAIVYKKFGLLAYRRGQFEKATRQLTLSLEIVRDTGNLHGYAHTLMSLGAVYQAQGALAQAQKFLEESLTVYQDLSYQWGQAHVLRLLGQTKYKSGEPTLAEGHFQQSLAMARAMADAIGEGLVLNELGCLAHDNAQFSVAAEMYERAIHLLQPLDDKRSLARVWLNMADLMAAQQDVASAAAYYERGLTAAISLQDLPLLLRLLTKVALFAHHICADAAIRQTAVGLLTTLYHHPVSSDLLKQEITARLAEVSPPTLSDGEKRTLAAVQQQAHTLLSHLQLSRHCHTISVK